MNQLNEKWSWHKSLAFVVVAGMIIAGLIAYSFMSRIEKTTQSFVGGQVGAFGGAASAAIRIFQPRYIINTVIHSAIKEVKIQPKLVVLAAEVSVIFERQSSAQGRVSHGTSTVELRFSGNKVQYVIPTDEITHKIFKWDKKRNEITLNVPDPYLDEELVEVQSDPSKIEIRKEVGWFRFDDYDGVKLLDTMKSQMRDEVVKAGKNELLLYKARTEARKVLKNIFLKQFREKIPEKENIIIIN